MLPHTAGDSTPLGSPTKKARQSRANERDTRRIPLTPHRAVTPHDTALSRFGGGPTNARGTERHRSSATASVWKSSKKQAYCETDAFDASAVGICGNGIAAVLLLAPPPDAPAAFVLPACPRRPRCAPCATAGSLAATGRIGGCEMYRKLSSIALLPVSYGWCTKTLLVTAALACANAAGTTDIAAVAAAAPNATKRTSEPVFRVIGWAVTLRFLQCGSGRQSLDRRRHPPEKIGPRRIARAERRSHNTLGGTRRNQSSPSHRKEDFMPYYSYYFI